ncbi:phosphotransferase [Gordonia pseudamarae]|uniref:Phosphotransferase n=1 Tax=Gordonia pseudamarae TaxID=2831662 RepID=A0ABX6IHX5_9ACTN|nr:MULTISPECIES: phosphotransferase [Gordonia]MBD0024097.1 phosphotransferase [Gordonia sp. (in: high G+C Gram-positive bacteria)]QHN25979.1 phosphotransferase [Gordonia pseudamarae]QHN34910.1 phosphotransferase [Gordonia pseudamarae]
MTTAEASLPRTVEHLTADWFTAALSTDRPGIRVTDVEVERVIWGSATKVFARLAFDGDSQNVPEHVCIKGGFDERSRAFGLGSAYELEGAFFRDLSPELTVEHPRGFYAASEAEQGIVIMEDLTQRGAEFCDGVNLWGVDAAAETLELLAGLHGETWDTKPGRFDWLPVGVEAARQAFQVMLGPEMFGPLVGRDEVPELPDHMRDGEFVRTAFAKLWEYDDAATHVINHGDAHTGQLYRIPGGRTAYLDWQTACLAPWAHDVAYFLGSALDTDDRRTHERALLTLYRDALAAAGGPHLTDDVVWEEYRRHSLHGFFWMCVPTVMQPSEVVRAMTHRYGAQIEDLDPFELLGMSH